MANNIATPGDAFRAESNGLDAVHSIRAAKRLVTAQRNGKRIGNPFTITSNINEAVLSARAAGRFANRVLDAREAGQA